jgi:hypothetical protein
MDKIDRDLGVLDPPGGAGVLALHPDGRVPLLHVAGLVDDEDGLLGAEVTDDVLAQIIADRVRVPLGPLQQMLHAVRSGLTGPLRDRPAVLARQIGQQSANELPHPLDEVSLSDAVKAAVVRHPAGE